MDANTFVYQEKREYRRNDLSKADKLSGSSVSSLGFRIISVTLASSFSLDNPDDISHFAALGMIKHWKWLPRETVVSSSLSIFKTQPQKSTTMDQIISRNPSLPLSLSYLPSPCLDSAVHICGMPQQLWKTEGPEGLADRSPSLLLSRTISPSPSKQFGRLNAWMLTQDESFATRMRKFLKQTCCDVFVNCVTSTLLPVK